MYPIALIVFFQLIIESLPISSSTHIKLLENFLIRLPEDFDHFLHGPTIIVLVLFFYREWKNRMWWFLPTRLIFRHSKMLHSIALKIFSFAFVSNLITGIIYFLFKYFHNSYLDNKFVLIGGLTITCLLLFSLLFFKNSSYEVLTINKIIVLGFVQGLALIPGISRFASTYVIARFLKLSPRRAFQTSFLIEFPLCIAAFLKGLLKLNFHLITMPVLLSMIIAIPISICALKFSYILALRNKFWLFSCYMPILIAVIFLFF